MWTLYAAAALFLVFGIKMAQEARHMQGDEMAEEMREAEEEIEEDSSLHDPTNRSNSLPLEAIEEGRVTDVRSEGRMSRPLAKGLSGSRPASPAPERERGRGAERGRRTSSRSRSRPSIQISIPGVGPLKDAPWIARTRENCRNAIQMVTNPVFAQAFILTFLGEWGDRSQITTIAMAGAHVSEPTKEGAGLIAARGERLISWRSTELTPVNTRHRLRDDSRPLAVHAHCGYRRTMGQHQAFRQEE